MKAKIALAVVILSTAVFIGVDAQASESSQCLLQVPDQLFEMRRGGGGGEGLIDTIMKMILQVMNEMMRLVARVVCSIINEFGVRCR